MPPLKLRNDALREVILQRAVHLLEVGGTPAIHARSVARAAQTSTAAVYELFGDKAGLVRAMFFEGFRLLDGRLLAAPVTGDARADLCALLDATRAFAIERPMFHAVMYARPFVEFEPSEAELEAGAAVYRFVLRRVRDWLASAGPGGAQVDLDPVDAAHALVASSRGLITAELAGVAGTTAESIERRWRLTIDAMLDGLAARAITTPTRRPR